MSEPTTPPAALTNPIISALKPAERALFLSHLEPIVVEPNQPIVEEGAVDRAMYFIVSGAARIRRGGVDLGPMTPGEHFGELALVMGEPRAASVIAVERTELLRLSLEAARTITRSSPDLTLHLMRGIVGGVAERLFQITDSVGALMMERSLPRRLVVNVRIMGAQRTVRNGTQLKALLPQTHDGHPVVAALLDHKPVSLNKPVSGDGSIEPLTGAHWEGKRILRRSLALLLLEAAARLEDGPELSMGHSVGIAQRVEVKRSTLPLAQLTHELEAKMRALAEQGLPLLEEWWTLDEAREHLSAAGWSDAHALLSTWRAPAVPMVSYGSIYALRLGPTLPSSSLLTSFRLSTDEEGLLLIYGRASAPGDRASEATVDEARAVSKQTGLMSSQQSRWLRTLDVHGVGELNRACIRGEVSQLIGVSEGFQEKSIGAIADRIAQLQDEVDVVSIAGPSASGKSTFIKRLSIQLRVNGINPVGLSLDDYYVDRELTPRDEQGEYDFEAFEALRFDLLQEHLQALHDGRAVQTARFDFKTGRSAPSGGRLIQLGPRDVLMLEGIHGLNPRLLGESSRVFRIFVCPLAQLPFDRLNRVHASDLRLLRRVVRDRHARATTAADTIMRWPSVRSGERKNIYPFQQHAQVVFDSSLVYELPVLKVFAERYLLEVENNHPAHTTAYRLLQLVDQCVSLYPDHVPPNSILREFIGGSGFES